jgi:hypothetical protein
VKHALSCRAAPSSAAEMPLWLEDCARNITHGCAATEIPTRPANADDRQTRRRPQREKRSVTGARASSSGIGVPGKRSRHQTIPRNDGYEGGTTASQSTPQRRRQFSVRKKLRPGGIRAGRSGGTASRSPHQWLSEKWASYRTRNYRDEPEPVAYLNVPAVHHGRLRPHERAATCHLRCKCCW